MNRKLFVSFTALLKAMRDDKVTEKDLERGLFYFGCTRRHAFEPGAQGDSNELEWFFKDATEATATHQVLLKYVEKAEKDGRCVWREASQPNTYEQLNALLVKHGYSYNRDKGPAIITEARTEAEKYNDAEHKAIAIAIVFEYDNRTENPYCYRYPGVRDRVAEAGIPLDVVAAILGSATVDMDVAPEGTCHETG